LAHETEKENEKAKRFTMVRSICIAIDTELDGPSPMEHSLRSFCAVAFTDQAIWRPVFYARLLPQEGAKTHPEQMQFWEKHPEAWQECQRDPVTPTEAMARFSQWLYDICRHQKHVTMIAQPPSVDYMFLKCYYEKYGPEKKYRLPYYCQDFVAMRLMYRLLNGITKTRMEEYLRVENPRPHHADCDALQLAHMCRKLRQLVFQSPNFKYAQLHQ
jgi:hypothetical protein